MDAGSQRTLRSATARSGFRWSRASCACLGRAAAPRSCRGRCTPPSVEVCSRSGRAGRGLDPSKEESTESICDLMHSYNPSCCWKLRQTSMRTVSTSTWPQMAAICSGVRSLTSRLVTSAPLCNKASTQASCPLEAFEKKINERCISYWDAHHGIVLKQSTGCYRAVEGGAVACVHCVNVGSHSQQNQRRFHVPVRHCQHEWRSGSQRNITYAVIK